MPKIYDLPLVYNIYIRIIFKSSAGIAPTFADYKTDTLLLC